MALAVESCSAWPNYIAFFNAPSGGTRNAVFKLSDSNLDWGQDLKLLADWHKEHPDKLIYLCYFGTADPSYYGINRVDLPGGYVFSSQFGMPQPQIPGIIAMSVTDLQGTYMSKEMRIFTSRFAESSRAKSSAARSTSTTGLSNPRPRSSDPRSAPTGKTASFPRENGSPGHPDSSVGRIVKTTPYSALSPQTPHLWPPRRIVAE